MNLLKNYFKFLILIALIANSSVGYCQDEDNDVPAIDGVKSAVNGSTDILKGELDKIGSQLQQTTKTLAQSQGSIAKQEIQNLRDLMVQTQIAEAKRRAIEQFGDQATDPTCYNEGLGNAVINGKASANSTAANAGRSSETRSRNGDGTRGTIQKTKDLLSIEEEKIKLEDIYPTKKTLTPEQKDLVSQINQHIIDPFPPNKISNRAKEQEIGKKYEATRLIYEKLKEAPRQAQNLVLSMKTADYPVNDWATGAWKDMGKSGIPDGVDNNTGKMSYDAFLALYVNSRIANENWYKRFDTQNDSWQLRQINMNSAISLEMQYQQLKILTHLLEIAAQDRANKIDESYGIELDNLLNKAESTQ